MRMVDVTTYFSQCKHAAPSPSSLQNDRRRLSNFRVGNSRLDLVFFRKGERANVEVRAIEGDPMRVQIQI